MDRLRRLVDIYDWMARIHFALFALGGAGLIVLAGSWLAGIPIVPIVALIVGIAFLTFGALGWYRSRRRSDQPATLAAWPSAPKRGRSDEALLGPPATEYEPTYKGTAMAMHLVRELTRIEKEAEQYRDDDPSLGRSYKCPSCDHRTYTVQGAPAMLSHISANHGPELGSRPFTRDKAAYPPYLDQVPKERFDVELAAYCKVRKALLTRGEALRFYLLSLDPAAKPDEDWDQRKLRPWVAQFDRHQGKWPEPLRLKGLGSVPTMTPYWAAKALRLVEPRLAWLRSHGTRCDE